MLREKFALRVKKVGLVSLVVVAMVISGFFVVSPFGGEADAQILGGEYGGNLRVALEAEPTGFNPLDATLNEPAMQIVDLLYDSLGRINPYTLELDPWVAESWEVDESDNSKVNVTLRNDVKWHSDDSILDVVDVEYTYDTYDISYLEDMTVNTTSNMVIFDLTSPDSRFFSEMLTMKLIPDGYEATSTDEMGCGPFYLDTSDADEAVIIAYEDYFKGRPYLDSITYTYYPDDFITYPQTGDDPDKRAFGTYRAGFDLLTGELDFIAWDLTSNDTTMNIEIPHGTGNNTNMVQNETVSVQRNNGLDYWYIGFNCDKTRILNDAELRKGIAYAIDKAALTVFDIGGGLQATNSIVSQYNVPWYNSSTMTTDYDVSEANSIMATAGYHNYHGTGWRELPDAGGTPFSFELLGPPEEDLTPNVMAGMIETAIQSVGINVTLVRNSTAVHMTDIVADDFDMFIATEERTAIDPQFLNGMFHSEKVATDENLLNFAHIILVENLTLSDPIGDERLDDWDATTLPFTNLEGAFVYHNDTLLIDTNYALDFDTGEFTLTTPGSVDLGNETLNITYYYRGFDHYIELANAEMDGEMRAKYIKEAQGFISEQVPVIPLFSFKVNHAYNSTGKIGWISTLGGINNFWSFTNLRNPLMEDKMAVSIGLPPAISSDGAYEGEEFNLNIKVEDIDGNPLEDADLMFTGEGTFGTPEYSDGTYTVPYMTPSTTSLRTVTVTATAAKISYGAGKGDVDITVHPVVNEFNIDVTKADSSIPSGNTTTITFNVEQKAYPYDEVEGASVIFSVTPTSLGGYLDNYSGVTDANGDVTVTFGATNVTIDTTFKITADVSMDGYLPAQKSTSINVVKGDFPPPDKGFLGLPAPSIIVVLLTFASMAIVFSIRRRR